MTTMTDEERAEATARVVFLMPGLTAAGLRAVRETAELWAARDPRDLTSGTLAAEQAARHGLLADADAVLSKARRERTHGLNCDCGACTSQTAATVRECVTLLVTDPSGAVLLVQSMKPERAWELPGGGVNDGESVEDAAIRECVEESGIAPTSLAMVRTMVGNPKPGAMFSSRIFLVSAQGYGEPVPGDDAIGAGWWTAAQVLTLHEKGLLSDLVSRDVLLSWAREQTAPADLHDSATDAAAVLGSTGLDVASVGDVEGMRTLAAVGDDTPPVLAPTETPEVHAARERVSRLNQRFTSYDGGDRPMSPPVSLIRELAAAEADLARRFAGSIDRPREGHTDTTTPGHEWRVTGEAEGPPGFGMLPILDLVPVKP